MGKHCEGKLEKIKPNLLVSESKNDPVESFLLSISVVFNDLKGLIKLDSLVLETYDMPTSGDISCHSGNFSGIRVQINKLIAGIIDEFIELLKVQQDIYESEEFKRLLGSLAKSDRGLWEGMFAAARGEDPNANSFIKTLLYVRNNVAYHYDQSGKVLRKAYISKFFGKADDPTKEFAFYSIGPNMEETRFFFADGAVEEAIYLGSGKAFKEKSFGDPSFDKYQSQIRNAAEEMNVAIVALMKKYIQSRRARGRSL
jgi:hypothetical protein